MLGMYINHHDMPFEELIRILKVHEVEP